MARTKEQKKEIVAKVEEILKGATSVFVHFTGITVNQESTMRRALRGEGLGYMVAKKTLIRRALNNLGHTEELPLEGEVAVAYTASSDDETAAARRIHGFGKELGEGKLTILGGLFGGKLVDAKSMQEIATIPSMDTLRGMFANVINSPRARFAVALSEVAKTKSA
ncbi:50S ribosomal protein L10 [Candidatus Parcubacteria bacterium]|nr:MAG: 50S ribosomal protein L10 [Candidatus Parcubacteria bacterium]